MFEENIVAIPSGSVLDKKQTDKLSELMPFKVITDEEIARMFGMSIEEFKKEVGCGNIHCFAKDDKIWIIPTPSNRPIKVVCEGDDFLEKFYDFEKIIDGVEFKYDIDDFDCAVNLIAKLIDLCDMSQEEQRKVLRPIRAGIGDYMGSGYAFTDAFNKIMNEFSYNCSDELWQKISLALDNIKE